LIPKLIRSSDVLLAVQSSLASFGVIPFENSSNGFVSQTLDCLIDRGNEFPDVVVCGVAYIDVQHCLVGYTAELALANGHLALSPTSSGQMTPTIGMPDPCKPRTQPLFDLHHIMDVYSHPQALGQCDDFLSTYLRAASRHEVTSTSQAAEDVAKDPARTSAAICSRLAADVHGLSLLAENIQNSEDNKTRFLILRREDGPKFPMINNGAEKSKALVAFSINHEAYGALARALLIFEKHTLNLTSINHRPSRIRPWHYIFLAEFCCDGISPAVDENIEIALKNLGKVTEGYECLGCWRE